jgi:hypothetical protein
MLHRYHSGKRLQAEAVDEYGAKGHYRDRIAPVAT